MEEKIISLLPTQSSEAAKLLYDHYAPALFGVILRVVHSRELAEQVLQDTLIKVWRFGNQFDRSKGRLFTWMLNIARNTAIDATRTGHYKFHSRTDDIQTLVHRESGDSLNPEHIGLRQLVGQLDEKYRVLIEKIYFEGFTHQEVEEAFGTPIGTVKTRLRYAIQELRGKFEDADIPAHSLS